MLHKQNLCASEGEKAKIMGIWKNDSPKTGGRQ